MLLLEGKSVSKALRAKVKEEIAALSSAVKRVPGLAVILVGEDPASQVYVRNKEKACEEVGITSYSYRLPHDIGQENLIKLIRELNADDRVDGILLQLPLPEGLNTQACLQAIDPRKDVDGLHPENQGRLALGLKALRPCTPAGTLFLLDYYKYDLEGKNCVVLGRSHLVGRPLAMMLNDKTMNATVTMCHSKTRNLKEICRQADFIFLAYRQTPFSHSRYGQGRRRDYRHRHQPHGRRALRRRGLQSVGGKSRRHDAGSGRNRAHDHFPAS